MENLQNNKTPSRAAVNDEGRMDAASLSKKWSPEEARVQRSQRDEMKLRSIQGGRVPLRGGDFVLDRSGGSVTLSFCFYKNNKKYGLTVAHLCCRVSDTVYVFNLDEPLPNGRYAITPIGKVV
jgi:hypothetical protein